MIIKTTFPIIHIAGTNGKGSTAYKIAFALKKAGYKVGLFTSPHLVHYEERIQVDFENIPSAFVEEVEKKLPSGLHFFEKATKIGILYFEHMHVDVAVIEAGLGGRLDATNVYESILAVITSISFDHMQYLGDTLEKIAFEKAGIIKSPSPVVIGPKAKFSPIFEACEKWKAPYHLVEGNFSTFDEENSHIAKKALEVLKKTFLKLSQECIDEALLVRPICRYQQIGDFILDVAHNPDGFKELLSWVKRDHPGKKIALMAGFSSGKPIREIFCALPTDEFLFILTTSQHEKMAPLEDVQNLLARTFSGNFLVMEDISSAITYMKNHLDSSWVKVIAGSFYLMSECLDSFSFDISEKRDMATGRKQ